MKKLLVTIVILLILVGTLGAGVYLYGSSKKADIVLERNIKELLSLDNIERVEIEESSNGKIVFDIPFLEALGQTLPEQTMDKESTTIIDAEAEEVREGNDTVSLEDYKSTSLLFDEDLWEKVAEEKGYEISDIEEDGEEFWEYEIDEDIIKEAFVDNLQSNFLNSFANEDEGMKVVDIEFDDSEFEGLTMKVLISKEDNTLAGYSFSVEGDLIFNMEFGGSQIEEIRTQMDISDTTGVLTFKDVSSASEVTEMDFVNGKEISTDIFGLLMEKYI
jgi:hypothetical protein